MASTLSRFNLARALWHNDGDLVIVCDRTGFRVHIHVLSAHSAVFRDMADMPPPSADFGERCEGCPIIRLQDSAEDMRYFLQAIYDLWYGSTSTCTPNPAKLGFTVASALLRLGTKYDATTIRCRAIDVFASVYPCTSDAWARRDSIRLFPPFAGELAATLTLAIENDVQSLIPAIFYTACKLPPPDVISEFLSLDLHPATVQELCKNLVSGRELLRQAELKLILGLFNPAFSRPRCMNLDRDTSWCAANPFKVGKSIRLCDCCCELIDKSIRAAVEEIWRRVPSMFGYAEWSRLREADDLVTL